MIYCRRPAAEMIVLLLDIDHPRRIGVLRGVCGMFRCLPLRELRPCLGRPGAGWLLFEDRLRLAGNPEAICYAEMEMLMTRQDRTAGLALFNQAVVGGDSGTAYFLAMMRCHSNPADHETLVLLHGISGGPVSYAFRRM